MNSSGFYMQDALIAAIIMICAIAIIFQTIQENITKTTANSNENEKQLTAITISESLIKNRNEKNPEIGSAYYDKEKHRIKQNTIDEGLLRKTKSKKFGKFTLAGIYEKSNGYKNIYFDSKGKNCTTMERFVIIKGITEKKAIIGVKICE